MSDLLLFFVTTVSNLGNQVYDFFNLLNHSINTNMKICLVAYIQGKEFSKYLRQIQLVRYFRFSGHKLVHLDLGGAPPKLTYLLQVIPFENHYALVCIFCRRNRLLSQILSFHSSLFLFAFAYFYIASHRCWLCISFMAPLVFHIGLGWQMRKSLFANSSDQDMRSCVYIAVGKLLSSLNSEDSFVYQRLICGVFRRNLYRLR